MGIHARHANTVLVVREARMRELDNCDRIVSNRRGVKWKKTKR